MEERLDDACPKCKGDMYWITDTIYKCCECDSTYSLEDDGELYEMDGYLDEYAEQFNFGYKPDADWE